jgi:hypothetical protein
MRGLICALVGLSVLSGCTSLLSVECGKFRTSAIDTGLIKPAKLSIVGNSFDRTEFMIEYQLQDGGRVSAEADIALKINGQSVNRINSTDPQCPNPRPFVGYRWELKSSNHLPELFQLEMRSNGALLVQHQVDIRRFTVSGIPAELSRTSGLALSYSLPLLRRGESIRVWASEDVPSGRGRIVHTFTVNDLSQGKLNLPAGTFKSLPTGRYKIYFVRRFEQTSQVGIYSLEIAYSALGNAQFADIK